MTPAPLVIVASDAACTAVLDALRRDGRQPVAGWSVPGIEWDLAQRRIVCHGGVLTPVQARAAVGVAARGAGVVAVVAPGTHLELLLHADLRRIGPVEVLGAGAGAPLDADQARILELIAAGATLPAVAEELSYSLRTVNRRLSGARAALGAGTTAEAVAALRRYPSAS